MYDETFVKCAMESKLKKKELLTFYKEMLPRAEFSKEFIKREIETLEKDLIEPVWED